MTRHLEWIRANVPEAARLSDDEIDQVVRSNNWSYRLLRIVCVVVVGVTIALLKHSQFWDRLPELFGPLWHDKIPLVLTVGSPILVMWLIDLYQRSKLKWVLEGRDQTF